MKLITFKVYSLEDDKTTLLFSLRSRFLTIAMNRICEILYNCYLDKVILSKRIFVKVGSTEIDL